MNGCKYWILAGIVLFVGSGESVAASDVEALKTQIVSLRAEQAENNQRFQDQIDALEKQVFEIQGPLPTWIENSSQASKGFIDFNAYYDTEKYSVMTINAGADLPNDFSYFSLTNFSNAFGDGNTTEFDEFYTEQNITWSPPKTSPIAWNIQWNLRSGVDNDRFRLAPQWLVHKTPIFDQILDALNMTYKINFHAVQWDDETHGDYVWQMEHVYFMSVFRQLLDNRVYLSGFADHTFGGPGNPAVVTEHQVGVRVVDNFFVVAEYRRNEYRKGEEDSLGFGLQYKIIFK